MISKVQSLFIIKTHSKKLSGKNCYEKDFLKFYKLQNFEISIILNNKDGVQNFDSNSAHDLYVNIDRRLIKIDIQKICLVEAKGDYINIKTETDSFRVHSSLKKIKEKLPEQLFVKVHRSFIINIEKIIDIEDNSVLINKDVIPVSRSNRSDLMKRLNLL